MPSLRPRRAPGLGDTNLLPSVETLGYEVSALPGLRAAILTPMPQG